MRAISSARCVFLVPFINIVDEAGAPTRSLLGKFRLPIYPEEKPNHYMPLLPALRFATTVQGAQGIADFGFHAGRRVGFGALSESFQSSVRHSPTLLAALRRWCQFPARPSLPLACQNERTDLRYCHAFEVFADASSFSRTFMRLMNTQPRVYRRQQMIDVQHPPSKQATSLTIRKRLA